jgi:hypothetical protein
MHKGIPHIVLRRISKDRMKIKAINRWRVEGGDKKGKTRDAEWNR